MIVKALSTRAWWAWAIVQNLKPYENKPRPWRSHTGPLLIHASTTGSRADYDWACDYIERLSGRRPPPLRELERGGIIGAVLLTGCAEPLKRSSGWRFRGDYGLALEHPIALPFRPMKGSLAPFPVRLTRREREILTPMLRAWEARDA